MHSDALILGCIQCTGDLCTPCTVTVPLSRTIKAAAELSPALLPSAALDANLTVKMLTQPLTLMAVGGMALLTYCVVVSNSVTDVLLMLIGGRDSSMPMLVLICANIAHAVEAFIALVVCMRLPRCGLGGALGWAALVLLSGFPILRHVLKFRAPKEYAA